MFRVSGRDLPLPPGKEWLPLAAGEGGSAPHCGGDIRPPFSFYKRKRAVDGPKEKGAFPDEQGSSWPLNRAVSGFRPPGYRTVLFPRFKRAAAEFTGRAETFRVSGRDLLLPPELAERGGAFLRRGTFCPCKKYPKTRLGDWRPACSPACGGEQRPPPPKNPREFTGAVIRIAWSIRAAHGYRIDGSLTTIAIDLVLPSASAASETCAALRRCLPVPRDPGFRRPPE